MSLYQLQKLLYQLNRDPQIRMRFEADRGVLLTDYELEEEEREAIRGDDIGLLYVLGVNGQILMHYAAMCGYEWQAYLQAMRDGLEQHGPVRRGLYATVWD